MRLHFAREILRAGQEGRSDVDLNVHERRPDTASTQKIRAKKMAAPESGQVQGGNAQEGRRPRNRRSRYRAAAICRTSAGGASL